MSRKLQFGIWLAVGIGVAMAFPAVAQNRPPKPKQEQRQERQQERRQERPQPRNERNQGNPNRPPVSQGSGRQNSNRPPASARNEQNRPPSAYAPPARNFNNLSPQEKQRTLENNKDFQRRTPAEQQRIKRSLENWIHLTPEQKSHVRNEVMPKWRQLPADRQRAIGSRLNVLQNMPESARNQHLSDPNFTRGMSEEDKSMLRDLSHLHVGGAPEEPHE